MLDINASSIKGRIYPYLTHRWLVVYGYLAVLLIATPCLPLVLNWARARWQGEAVSSFVLIVEITIGITLILSAGSIFFYNRRKFTLYIILMGALIGASGLSFLLNPNPYELTHLPEYAILGVLLIVAMKKGKERGRENFLYVRPAAITVLLGTADELYQGLLPLRYFAWYDIILNGLGGVLGLTMFWGMKRE
jgi:glycopeptide antibiotics resistance protein